MTWTHSTAHAGYGIAWPLQRITITPTSSTKVSTVMKVTGITLRHATPVNDDIEFKTRGWAKPFTNLLLNNPVFPGLGVVGPKDLNRPDNLMTQSFVSRVHMHIFGMMFPPMFRNWWSDDWISKVYTGVNSAFFTCALVPIHTLPTFYL